MRVFTVRLLRACDKLVYIMNFQKEDLVHKHFPNILNLRAPSPPFLCIFGGERLVFYGTQPWEMLLYEYFLLIYLIKKNISSA